MELIFYRKLLSLFGGLIIIIDLANAGMVPIGHPNNAKGNRPPFSKPNTTPGINTSPSVTVHGRPDHRPNVNSQHGPQPAMSFGITQHKPPPPSNFASSQSSVGNSQSHLIYTQNTAGTGADPVMIVASTQNALNETENTHTVPLDQMASIFTTALAAPQEELNPGNSQVPDPDNNAVHIETPILSVATNATQTSENLQLAGQESVAAHIPSDTVSSQNEVLVVNNSPENIPLSETNSANVVTEVEAQPPSSSLEAYPAITISQEVIPDAVHTPINSHVDATAVLSPSYADDDHENHFDLEAYLAQANMVLGTSDSYIQPVQTASVIHPSENMEAVEMNAVEASVPPTSSIAVPEASDPPPSSFLVPEVSDPPPSSISVPEANAPSTLPDSVPNASVPPTSSIAVPEASDPPPSSFLVPEVSDPPPSSISVPEASAPSTLQDSVPNASVLPTSPISAPVPVVEEPAPQNLQLVETPSTEIQEPLPIPASAEIETPQNEVMSPQITLGNNHVSEENLSNVIPEVLSEQAILSMPNDVFEESVLNIEIAHHNTVPQSQLNNHENDAVHLADNTMADVSPIAPVTVDHNEHDLIPSNPEVAVSSTEETFPLLLEASQATPNIPVVNVQLEEVLPEVHETNTITQISPVSVTPEEAAVNAAEASLTQVEETLTNHSPLNVEAQNIYSSPVEDSSASTNASDDDDDPPFNVEQYLAQAALLLGSKSYQPYPYIHDDLQGSTNDLYYSDKQNFQQSSEHFGKDKMGSGTVKANQYYTHFGNKFTSAHGTGKEYDGNNLKPKENNANIVDESQITEPVKSDEDSNKVESLDTPISPSSSHSSHSASTRPLPGPPHAENLDENILLTMVNPGNENEISEVEQDSHELPAESMSFPDEAALERARPFRPGFARPSSLGMPPMYTYSGGVLNSPLGEDIKLTEYSNIVPAASKNPNATAAAEPVKFTHNSLMPLLGSSSFNSYFNGSHTNISVPIPAASFIMAQAPSIPAPQGVPSMQHAVLNNTNIVSAMNNSQLKPTEFQSYYFPQESVKYANILINNGGTRPIVGSKNVVESQIVFVVPPKSESAIKSVQNDYDNLNPGQSVVDLLAQDRKKISGNTHFKRASASGKSLDKTNNRVSDSAKEDAADSELQEEPAAAEEIEDNNEKVLESHSTPENSVDFVESDNSSVQEEKQDAYVSDSSPSQGHEQQDEILNKEVESQPLQEQKEDDSDNESDSQPLQEQKEVDSDNESDSQPASEQKEDDLDNESDSQPASEQKEDDLDNESDSKPASEQKEDDLDNESDSQPASEQKEVDSDNEHYSQPASEHKEGDSDNEPDSQPTSEQKGDSDNESDSQPTSDQKEDDSTKESNSQLASEQNEDDLSNKSCSQSNEKQESGQQEKDVVMESDHQEKYNSEKKKDADSSSVEEDEYETAEDEETPMKDSENDISNVNENMSEEPEALPKPPENKAPSKSNTQEATKVKQPVEKEETPPAKVVPSKGSPSKTQIPQKEPPPETLAPSKETPPKSQAPPKDTPQKSQAPKENLPKDSPPKVQAPSKESPPKESLPKAQAPSKEAPPKESSPKAQAPPKDTPPKPQTSSQETSPKTQTPSKDNSPKDPPPKPQAPPPSPPQKDAGPPASGPSGPGLPPMPEPPVLIAPPAIQAMAPNLDQLQFSIPEPQFSIPDPQFSIPDPQFSIPEPNINSPALAMPPDVSEVIGMVNLPSFPTIGDGSKSGNSKGTPNSPGKPKPPKRPNNSNGPSKGSPQAQQNPPSDSKPHVNPQSPAILQQEILESVEISEEPEELSTAEMMISEELQNGEEEDESINSSDENEVQPQLVKEPSFNEKALPPSKHGRPFPPGFASPNPNPNPMFGNPAYGSGAIPQMTPGSTAGASPDKGCTCNSNSSPSGGANNNAGGNNNNSGGSTNNAGSSNNNAGGSSNSSGGGKTNPNNNGGNSNSDKGSSNSDKGNSNSDKGNSSSGKNPSVPSKQPSVPSKHTPAPTAAPIPAPVIDMESEDDSQSSVRPPRPTKPKRPNRPNGGGKKPKPKPSDRNNDKLKDVEVEDDLDPEFLQQAIANSTNIVFTPPKISDSKLESIAANNTSSSGSQNTPTKQTELFTVYSIFGWEIPVINWSYFTDIFQSFFVEKFRTSSGEFTCDESDNEATILRSELDVDYLCGDDIDYGRRDIRTLADSNICNMFCNSNGYSSGLCMPQKSCLCYMSEKKNFAIKLDRLADFTSNTTEKESSYGEDTCQNCRCLKSCQNNGKYVGYCSKSCHCGVPWYNEDPEITHSSSQK